MVMSSAQLADEVRFADSEYAQHAASLDLNPVFYQKYANPRVDWDWRQYGAKLLGSVSGKEVLDYGCGQGEESTYLALMGARVTAIDISPVGIELTRKRAEHNGVGDRVRALVMRGDPTEFSPATFDVVHGFGILHHVGLDLGLAEARRLLKPGGKALFFEHMGNSKLIENLKFKDDYTATEQPLRWDDVLAHSGQFARFMLKPFHIISRFRRRFRILDKPIFKRIDDLMLSYCPPLRHIASGLVIYIET